MNAKQHFYDALGGNMNIATLTPKAFEEIMEDYANNKLRKVKEELTEIKNIPWMISDVKDGLNISIEQIDRNIYHE